MAAASVVKWDLKASINEDPNSARVEDVCLLDADGITVHKHTRAAFMQDYPVSPDLIFEATLPTTYAGATGFTLVFTYYCELPVVAGNIIWEFAGQRLRSANSDSLVNAASWGTPTVASADTVPSTAAEVKKVSIALAKANVGGAGTPVAGDVVRFRLRRLNTNASDTCKSAVYVIGSLDIQDT